MTELPGQSEELDALRSSTEELLRDRLRLQSLLHGMLDPVVIIDANGRIVDASSSCKTVFGHAPDDLLGCNINLLMPEPHRSQHDEYLENYRRTGETHILGRTREFEVLCKDGRPIEVELSVSRVDVPGEGPLFCGSFRDITARKEAERALSDSERRFRAIFDREYEFVGLLDRQGSVLEVNRTALDAVGLERDEVVGVPFWKTKWWSNSAEEAGRARDAVQRALAGEFVRFETENVGADGLITVDFSAKPIHDEDGGVGLVIVEGRDITSLKQAQERETAMMRAFAEIGESASLLAHEIKNPITAVNAALRAVANKLGEDEQEVLTDLSERMQKLEALMRRTLSLARPIELKIRPCDVGELLAACHNTLQPRAEEVGVRIEVDAAPECGSIEADSGLLDEVLTNLVGNAIEALPSGGTIRLAAALDGPRVLFSVDDDGPGIEPRVLDTLFKPFVSTKASGTGLGLALTRKIVGAHGGSIEATKSPLGGARFVVALPVAASRAKPLA